MEKRHQEYMERRCTSMLKSSRQYLARFHKARRYGDMIIARNYLQLLSEKIAYVRAFALCGYVPSKEQWRVDCMEDVLRENRALLRT